VFRLGFRGFGRRLSPIAAIERPILDSFGEVSNGQVLCTLEVGDGTGYFKDTVVGGGSEPLLLHGSLKQALGVGLQAHSRRESAGWSSARWSRSSRRAF